ncbi:MAG TPA: M20/M25/M40 family metallo-hydrolase [Allosphingosinicella sp.]|jgi:acetylornithine deacetylase/succinyl-diaminopimelate desuccinylase-like protein|nr:M20/M25/M40 family metallo-hydrolase [Allosphingosinicella sp.]
MTARLRLLAAAALLAGGPVWAQAAPDEAAFRATYKELVETNTTLSAGSCTLAAERMAARLAAAGFPESDLHIVVEPSHPKEGSLVAVLPGSDPKAKAVLLLAHIDVVEANRADWARDPFTLVEEDGFFYARGASDDKAQAAIWVDTLIRLKREGFRPKRSIKMALTCGEETAGAFNGAQYLAAEKRDLIDAEFALNEGAGGLLDESGKPVVLNIQAGEKFPQNFRLEVTNAGGHSSRPVRENAIYRLADALVKIRAHDFPVQSNEATRGYFGAMAKLLPGPSSAAMAAFAADPSDGAAAATLAAAEPAWNAVLRTTCVATMLEGGHATNALPQRARANVNCRIFPGTSAEQVRQALEQVVADPQVKITTLETRSEIAPPPPLTERVLGPARKAAAEIFPGVPLVPAMAAGGTDAAFLTPAGIPTYGLSGLFADKEGSHAHGLDERIRVKSLMDGRAFLYRLVKLYSAK